jgi:uncharacterized protein DUF4019
MLIHHLVFQFALGGILAIAGLVHAPLHAQTQTQTATPSLQPNISAEDLQQGTAAGDAWLKLVDQGRYENSWEIGALSFQLTISKKEWNKALEAMRKPLGTVVSRQLLEQRVAYNPKGLPQGEYLVLYYKTAFSNRADANELLTLQKQNNGQWKLLTYHVR